MDQYRFIADLHVHSKFSRATARDLDLENLYIWAQRKGISVVGTGDFTHPEWVSLIEEKLEPAEPGLYKLKQPVARQCDEQVPPTCRAPVRFMLTCEISNIYKKKEKTRKNHNLVFFSDIDDVRQFNARLDSIGNICSDGRPILGLDARDLLEIVLETSDTGFLIPAHIWTPWFSMLGSKSGFDSLEECFDDLSDHIFAAETGLSSDPSMNWRVPELDGITLISNSDAHSPSKLGREANLFGCEMDYFAMRRALETAGSQQFLGTFEFYPEEGKYHVDGHRKCEVRFLPEQTQAHNGLCPVCGKPLTLGVLHRVEDLAKRPTGIKPTRAFPFYRLIPLESLLAEIFKVGEKSKKVAQHYAMLNQTLGRELHILHDMDRETIEAAGVPLLGEAIARVREGRISFIPGFDGEYGRFALFSDQERDRLMGQRSLFRGFVSQPEKARPTTESGPLNKPAVMKDRPDSDSCSLVRTIHLNKEQQAAVDHPPGGLMIVAGPGTGKTRTLTHKIAHLVDSGVPVERILAVTFTNKAAKEMQQRLESLLGKTSPLPFVGTFHGLGFRIVRESQPDGAPGIIDEAQRRSLVGDAMLSADVRGNQKRALSNDAMMGWIAFAKQQMRSPIDRLDDICPAETLAIFQTVYAAYEQLLKQYRLLDFEDLIFRSIRGLTENPEIRKTFINRFEHIFVDEFQDINAGQYQLIQLLCGKRANVTVIGDPDQAIYGFRGSDSRCFKWFLDDFPDAGIVYLRRNYRSTQTILDVSAQVIQKNPDELNAGHRRAIVSTNTGDRTIHIIPSASEQAEAVSIGKTIETMIGGTGFLSLDSDAVDGRNASGSLSFSDFAVLFRTRAQADPIITALEKAGIPCQFVDRRSALDHQAIQSLMSLFRLIGESGTVDDLHSAGALFNPAPSAPVLTILKAWMLNNNMSIPSALAQSRRLPIPGMGISRQQRLYAFVNQLTDVKQQMDGMMVADALCFIVQKCGLTERHVNDPIFGRGYRQLMAIAGDVGNDIHGFLAGVSLCRDTDTYDHRVENVSIMTLHAAKGLEFPVVFISGCEAGLIPYQSATRPFDLEEERRLFYVGLTRAERHLYLTHATSRRVNGVRSDRQCSPFVNDIEKRYLQQAGNHPKKSKPQQQQLSLF